MNACLFHVFHFARNTYFTTSREAVIFVNKITAVVCRSGEVRI